MWSWLAALILFLASPVTAANAHQYERMVSRTESSVVKITEQSHGGGQGMCTGIVIAQNRVLTAAHCQGDAMQADGRSAMIRKGDDFYDLLLLEVPTGRPFLPLSTHTPARGETVTAIGYAWGWDRLTVLTVHVLLTHMAPAPSIAVGLITQGGYIGGMSGGPVVDADGALVGIVQQTNDGIGYGVETPLIHAFLLGAL